MPSVFAYAVGIKLDHERPGVVVQDRARYTAERFEQRMMAGDQRADPLAGREACRAPAAEFQRAVNACSGSAPRR